MIIVNQDNNEIVNFDNITSIVINDVWDDKPGQVLNATDVRGSRHSLGYYKTEERAKEVLQEIIDTYMKIGIEFKAYNGATKRQLPVYELPLE